MKTTDLTSLIDRFPLLADLIALKEITWLNPRTTTLAEGCKSGWRKSPARPFQARCC